MLLSVAISQRREIKSSEKVLQYLDLTRKALPGGSNYFRDDCVTA
jgi:hypothetical protein